MALVILVALGLLVAAFTRRRRSGYWAWGAAALVWAGYVGPALVGAWGTLDTPEPDGLVTRYVRAALNEVL